MEEKKTKTKGVAMGLVLVAVIIAAGGYFYLSAHPQTSAVGKAPAPAVPTRTNNVPKNPFAAGCPTNQVGNVQWKFFAGTGPPPAAAAQGLIRFPPPAWERKSALKWVM
jgi:hypothetical protein